VSIVDRRLARAERRGESVVSAVMDFVQDVTPELASSRFGVASASNASAVALVAGAAGMAMSLERETDAREAALADKVRAQADAMADAAWEKIEASEASAEAVRCDVAARGVARVNGVMREDTARATEAYVRETLRTNDAGGDGRNLSVESFGNVYCKKNRWDLKLAYDAPVRAALRECVASMGEALTAVCGADAKLVELAALVSDPGSTRQPVHPDTAYRRDPSVFTCFVALQDVERDMGPTLFIPGTNNAQAHVEFREGNEREGPVFRRPYELGVISRGDATLFDSRTLHCGTENDSSRRRVLFYFSFQRADGDNPNAAISTIRTELRDKYTLADLLA
jgi:ectoine hydroxylase-related dioxygenase (phytanoyl-CoA dioxygenase family)